MKPDESNCVVIVGTVCLENDDYWIDTLERALWYPSLESCSPHGSPKAFQQSEILENKFHSKCLRLTFFRGQN